MKDEAKMDRREAPQARPDARSGVEDGAKRHRAEGRVSEDIAAADAAAQYLERKADAIERKSALDPDQARFAVQQLRIIAEELRAGFHVDDAAEDLGKDDADEG